MLSVLRGYQVGEEGFNWCFTLHPPPPNPPGFNVMPLSLHNLHQFPQCKNQEKPEKDERRSLQKLPLVEDIKSEMESREITSRLDLDPGSYFLVPYTMEAGQCGAFLIRILGEKDEVAAKTAWYAEGVWGST